MNKKDIFIIYLLVFLDILTKTLVLNLSSSINLGFIKIVKVSNTGTFWGLLEGFNIFFIILSFLVTFVLIYLISNDRNNRISYILFLSGVSGNLLDRLFRRKVIDFISVSTFPVFNLADTYIVIGVIIYIIKLVKENRLAA